MADRPFGDWYDLQLFTSPPTFEETEGFRIFDRFALPTPKEPRILIQPVRGADEPPVPGVDSEGKPL